MRESFKVGFSFGLTSGVITTLGLMVGLYTGTHSRIAVVGGILTIAIADAFSDALGIHIHEESEDEHSVREIWESTGATFVSKLVFALTFLIPVYLFPLGTAVLVSVVWGMFLLGALSFKIAREQENKARHVIAEHLGIALLVISITCLVGEAISKFVVE